jgi:hypothetical protein
MQTPLAIWDLQFTEEPTFWARYNYLSPKDRELEMEDELAAYFDVILRNNYV